MCQAAKAKGAGLFAFGVSGDGQLQEDRVECGDGRNVRSGRLGKEKKRKNRSLCSTHFQSPLSPCWPNALHHVHAYTQIRTQQTQKTQQPNSNHIGICHVDLFAKTECILVQSLFVKHKCTSTLNADIPVHSTTPKKLLIQNKRQSIVATETIPYTQKCNTE